MTGIAELTDKIGLISQFIITVAGLGGALTTFCTPFRNWIIRKIKEKYVSKNTTETILADLQTLKDGLAKVTAKQEERDKAQAQVKAALIATLRNSITRIYYQSRDARGIEDNDRENFVELCNVYHELGGNHYVKDLYGEVLRMPSLTAKKHRTTRKSAK